MASQQSGQLIQPQPQQQSVHALQSLQQQSAYVQQLLLEKERDTQHLSQLYQRLQESNQFCHQLRIYQHQIKSWEEFQLASWKLERQLAAENIKSFENLRVVDALGVGSEAAVFKCAFTANSQLVAAKVFFNYNTTSRVGQLKNEYQILSPLPLHVNIIPILHHFDARPTTEFSGRLPRDVYLPTHPNGQLVSTFCVILPLLGAFDKYLNREFRNLTVLKKWMFISDIIDGLVFLFDNNIMHRDMKTNNLMINSNGRIIISDFGFATKVSPDKFSIPDGIRGGNSLHLAPEVKRADPTAPINFSKQPSYELGVLAHEIYFGIDCQNMSEEHMDNTYFGRLCPDATHNKPQFFDWLRSLLISDPAKRLGLHDAARSFRALLTTL